MERADDVLVQAFGSEAAERVRSIERELRLHLAKLGRVQPIGTMPEPPPKVVEEPEPAPTKPALEEPKVWRVPPDASMTMREFAERKRRLYPDYCDFGPSHDSPMRRRY